MAQKSKVSGNEEQNMNFALGTLPYTNKEDWTILHFIINNDYYKLVGGTTIFKLAEKKNICPGRTWQSLRQRFRRIIMPRLRSYGLPDHVEKQFKSYSKFSNKEKFDARIDLINKRICLSSDDESPAPKKKAVTSEFRYPSLNVQRSLESPMTSTKNQSKDLNTEASTKRDIVSSSLRINYRKKSKQDLNNANSTCSKDTAASTSLKSDDELEILHEGRKEKTFSKQQHNSKNSKIPNNSKSVCSKVSVERTSLKSDDDDDLEILHRGRKEKTLSKQQDSSKSSEMLNSSIFTAVEKKTLCDHKMSKLSKHDNSPGIQKSNKKAINSTILLANRKTDSSSEECDTDESKSAKLQKLLNDTRVSQQHKNSSTDSEIQIESPKLKKWFSSKKSEMNVIEKIDSSSEESCSDSKKLEKKYKSKKRTPVKGNNNKLDNGHNHLKSSKSRNVTKESKTFQRGNKNDLSNDGSDSSSEENNSASDELLKRSRVRRSKHLIKGNDLNYSENPNLLALMEVRNYRKRRRILKSRTKKYETSDGSESDKDSGSDSKVNILKKKDSFVGKVNNVISCKCIGVIKKSKACQATWTGTSFQDKCIQVNLDEDERSNAAQEILLEDNPITENFVEKGEILLEEAPAKKIKIEKVPIEENEEAFLQKPSNGAQDRLGKDKECFENKIEAQNIIKNKRSTHLIINPLGQILVDNMEVASQTILNNEEGEIPSIVNPVAKGILENNMITSPKNVEKGNGKIFLRVNPDAQATEKNGSFNSQTLLGSRREKINLLVNFEAENEEEHKRKKSRAFDCLTKEESDKLKSLIKKMKKVKSGLEKNS